MIVNSLVLQRSVPGQKNRTDGRREPYRYTLKEPGQNEVSGVDRNGNADRWEIQTRVRCDSGTRRQRKVPQFEFVRNDDGLSLRVVHGLSIAKSAIPFQ
jgi:hypothetical protein